MIHIPPFQHNILFKVVNCTIRIENQSAMSFLFCQCSYHSMQFRESKVLQMRKDNLRRKGSTDRFCIQWNLEEWETIVMKHEILRMLFFPAMRTFLPVGEYGRLCCHLISKCPLKSKREKIILKGRESLEYLVHNAMEIESYNLFKTDLLFFLNQGRNQLAWALGRKMGYSKV